MTSKLTREWAAASVPRSSAGPFAHANALGARRLEWEAEPNAIGFCAKLGGSYLREGEPGAWGRRLPIMGLDLSGNSERP